MATLSEQTVPGVTGGDDASLNPNSIFNLGKAVVMVVDDNPFSMRLITQTLLGFGVQTRFRCSSAEEAQAILGAATVDLLIVDTEMPGVDGYDLIHHLRRSDGENAWIPIIMVAGHTPHDKVTKARDCGANFVIALPLSPQVLLQRILWVARDSRRMLQSAGYYGPDRRFREYGPPEGVEERRKSVLRAAAKAAAEAGQTPDDDRSLTL